MALVGRRDGRNFGWGRQLSYAGPQALRDMFGGGHYGTVKAHSDRWQAFVRWCRSENGPGFNDAREIDRQTLLNYAAHLRELVARGELAIATAHNRLCSVNRTMAALRGDQCMRLPRPSKVLGTQRTSVRASPPQGLDRDHVARIVKLLQEKHPRAAAIVLLARTTGMRLREAILADLPRLEREAKSLGKINIQDGTKGGRRGSTAPRWIGVSGEIYEAIHYATAASPPGGRILLGKNETYLGFNKSEVRLARSILKANGLNGFHELRASYACEHYRQITHHHAAVNGGFCHLVAPMLDREARIVVSYELGHGRLDVVSAYLGGRT